MIGITLRVWLRLTFAAIVADSNAESTNILAIFLYRTETNAVGAHRKYSMEDAPTLADRDFVRFNLTNQTFSVTAESAKRLAIALSPDNPRKLSNGKIVYGFDGAAVPFALVISGEIIYDGEFSSPLSSRSRTAPGIWARRIYVPVENTNRVTFDIVPADSIVGGPQSKANIYDARIRAAIKKLGL